MEREYIMLYEPEPAIKPGDYVRSYDFKGSWRKEECGGQEWNADCYIEGHVIKIAPYEGCGDRCDHYHIKVKKVVWSGEEKEEIHEAQQIVYPHTYDGLTGKNFGVQHAEE